MIESKKMILSALVAAVCFLAVGYLFYYMIFASFFAANTGSASGVYREEPVLWAVFLAQGALGTLTALVCAYAPRVSSVGDGMKAGAWIGIMIGAATAFDLYGATHVQNLLATGVDLLLWVVRASLAGGLATWLLDRSD